MRIAEVDVHAGVDRELDVVGELLAVVPDERADEMLGKTLDLSSDRSTKRAAWALHLLRRARQPPGDFNIPNPDHPALAEGAQVPQSAPPPELGTDGQPGDPMASTGPNTASLSGGTLCRLNLRQEPSAGMPHAGICAGGRPQGRSLPQPEPSTAPSCPSLHGASMSISSDGPCVSSSD